MNDEVLKIERDEWSFVADLTPLPDYAIFSWLGRSTKQRAAVTQQFIEETVVPRILDEEQMLPPIIIDISGTEKPSVTGLQQGMAMIRKFGPQFSRVVFVLNPSSRTQTLLRTFFAMWQELAPSGTVTIAEDMEAAKEMLRQHA